MSTPSPQEAEQEALIKKMLETEIFNLPQLVSNVRPRPSAPVRERPVAPSMPCQRAYLISSTSSAEHQGCVNSGVLHEDCDYG
jgi:hypothetical protein